MMMANAKMKQQLEKEGRPAGHIRCDTLGVCREIWQQDGIGGYWRGERVGGSGPGVGVGVRVRV